MKNKSKNWKNEKRLINKNNKFMAEKIIKRTKKEILIQYWNGHLMEIVRFEILIGALEKRIKSGKIDLKTILKKEQKMITNMPAMVDVTVEIELEDLRQKLEEQKTFLEVIKEKFEKEDGN